MPGRLGFLVVSAVNGLKACFILVILKGAVLANGTVCNDRNILDLWGQVWKPVVTWLLST